MLSIKVLLIILALLSFFVAALGVPTGRFNMTAVGLFLWLAAETVT